MRAHIYTILLSSSSDSCTVNRVAVGIGLLRPAMLHASRHVDEDIPPGSLDASRGPHDAGRWE